MQSCRHLAGAGRRAEGRGYPAVGVPRSWLTSLFRVVGLVPAPPPPPRSYTLKRAGNESGASVRWGRTHAAGNTAAARSWWRGHPQPQPALLTWSCSRWGWGQFAVTNAYQPLPTPCGWASARGWRVPVCADFQPLQRWTSACKMPGPATLSQSTDWPGRG